MPSFVGVWHNQHNSEMELFVDADGGVTGTYKTGVGSPAPSEEFDLVGFAQGDQLSFTVDFSDYGTLTSWVGQLTVVSGTEQILTMWHLSENIPDVDEPTRIWNTVTDGSDTFWRGPVPPAPPDGPIPLAGTLSHPSHPLKRQR